jgi:hypothetical protein
VLTGETQWARYEQQIRRYLRSRLLSQSAGISPRAMQQSLHAGRWGVGVFKKAMDALIGNDELRLRQGPGANAKRRQESEVSDAGVPRALARRRLNGFGRRPIAADVATWCSHPPTAPSCYVTA